MGDVHPVEGGQRNIFEMDDSARRALRIDQLAVVYQDPSEGLDLKISAGGNIAERLTAAGWRNFKDIRDRATELLHRTEVPLNRMDDPVQTFSGGMRQRVQLAKALANKPPVLILDERLRLKLTVLIQLMSKHFLEKLSRRSKVKEQQNGKNCQQPLSTLRK